MNGRELNSNTAWRLTSIRHAEEFTANGLTYRRYGISRQAYCPSPLAQDDLASMQALRFRPRPAVSVQGLA